MYPLQEISSPRLRLSKYSEADATSFFELISANRSRLQQFIYTLTACQDEEKTKKFLAQLKEEWENKSCFAYGIYPKESNTFIGHIFIESIEWKVPKCEIGYLIDAKEEGKGYTSEALQTITDYCLSELNMARVYLRIHPSNAGSLRVAEKSGYQKEGLFRNDWITMSGEILDMWYLSVIKNA